MSSLYSMKVVSPDSGSHIIAVIPRYYGFADAVLTLSNLSKDVDEEVAHTEQLADGVLDISFDYAFNEGEKYTVKLMESNEVIWRGNLFATTQETQDFDITKNYYSYG